MPADTTFQSRAEEGSATEREAAGRRGKSRRSAESIRKEAAHPGTRCQPTWTGVRFGKWSSSDGF